MASRYARIYAAAKRLNLDEETRRDIYEKVTGKRSLTAMSMAETRAVEKHMNGLAPPSDTRGSATRASGPYAGKLQALWIAAWNLGIVRNRNDAAIFAFVKRQTGLDHTRFLKNADDAKKAIEALKGWMTREGGVDWGASKDPREVIVWAIFQKLVATGGFEPWMPELEWSDIDGWAWKAHYANATAHKDWSDEDWIEVQNRAGRKLRAFLAKRNGAA